MGRSLERDWNEKLADVERLERESLLRPDLAIRLVDPEERRRILSLSQDLPRLWHAATTSNVERKLLLGLLINDVTLYAGAATIEISVRWQTEACTMLEVPRFRRMWDLRRTDPAVIEKIRTMASTRTDSQIVAELNEGGYRSGTNGAFTLSIVRQLRAAYGIESGCPVHPRFCAGGQRGDGRYSTRAVAEKLGRDMATIVGWCRTGRLDAIQTVPNGPWWIRLTPETIAELSRPSEPGQRGDGRYSARAAAALLNRRVGEITAWCRAGRLDAVRAGRRGSWWIRVNAGQAEEPCRARPDT